MARALARTGHDLVTLYLDEPEQRLLGCHSLGIMGPGLDEASRSSWLLQWPTEAIVHRCRERGLTVWEMPAPVGTAKPHNAAADAAGEAA